MGKANWQKKERRDTKLFSAKNMPRSGGFWNMKGDSKSDKYLIENKTTDKESFIISTKIWNKINREALLSQRIPIISLEMGKDKLELVVLDKEDFYEIGK